MEGGTGGKPETEGAGEASSESSSDSARTTRYVRDNAEDTRRWFAHRFGDERFEPTIPGPRVRGRALELNDEAEPFLRDFGDRQFEGFVAFVDLMDFSTTVRGKSPKEIHDFVSPFLQAVTDVAVRINCLIDKTIGDEVMLVQPNMGDVAPWLLMGQALSHLAEIRRTLGTTYRFRVGLAYGSMFLGCVGSESFREWTVFGEVVHLAKRLHGIEGLDTVVAEHGIGVAFGILDSDLGLPGLKGMRTHPRDLMLMYLYGAQYAIRRLKEVPELKGISSYTAGLLVPHAAHTASDEVP